jgi:hypothetical protein
MDIHILEFCFVIHSVRQKTWQTLQLHAMMSHRRLNHVTMKQNSDVLLAKRVPTTLKILKIHSIVIQLIT